MSSSIISIAYFAKSKDAKAYILKSDTLRNMTLDYCYNIFPGYESLPPNAKNKVYDNVRAMMEKKMSNNVKEEA